jgi:APA family basic amino acid/polyamine antiporter
MTTLARRLHSFDYFTLAFGAMVGAGWLVTMDDWLTRGGPLGAMLGFAIGTLLLIPVGYAYARMVVRFPDCGTEIVYTTTAFHPRVGFFAGWMMLLAYLIVCPWEAVAIGKIAGHFIPALNTFPLYALGGKPVYLPQVLLGIALTALLTWINFRGIALTSRFQNWATSLFLLLFAVLVIFGGSRGSIANFTPGFGHAPFVSILLMLQIVPYFMTGFESVPKCSEESAENFRASHYARAIYTALIVGGGFYVLVIAVVTYVAPWQQLANTGFATAAAFQHASGSRLLVNLIFATAVMSLIKIFNANFVAAARLAFALGRSGNLPRIFGDVHPRNQSPWAAVLFIGAITIVASFGGDRLLVSIAEVGSFASAVGWLATSASLAKLGVARERLIAFLGVAVAGSFALLKIVPSVPGHFSYGEYIALTGWILLGYMGSLAGRRESVGTDALARAGRKQR